MATDILDAAHDDLLELLAEIICSRLTTKVNEPPKPASIERRPDRGPVLRPQERRSN